jgi:succinyl-CoA synthetase beta subunit
VEAVLVNIFGGIMKCSTIAEGILTALKTVKLKVPLVVRLEGTEVKEGKDLLAKSGLELIQAESLWDAAKKAVASLNGARRK